MQQLDQLEQLELLDALVAGVDRQNPCIDDEKIVEPVKGHGQAGPEGQPMHFLRGYPDQDGQSDQLPQLIKLLDKTVQLCHNHCENLFLKQVQHFAALNDGEIQI